MHLVMDLTNEQLTQHVHDSRTSAAELTSIARRHPELAVHVLGNPALSLKGLEMILADLLPFAPKPGHALAAARNPSLLLMCLAEPRVVDPVRTLILQLGDGAREGARAVATQLPWAQRHLLLDSYNEAYALEVMEETGPDLRPRQLKESRYRPYMGPSHIRRPGLDDDETIDALERHEEPDASRVMYWRDPRFQVANYILERALEYGTPEAWRLGTEMFRRLRPAGVQPPNLWQALIENLG